MTAYSAIGTPFGKLLKAKPKAMILAKSVSKEAVPFLQGFENGIRSFRPLEDCQVEEITEDIFETTYIIALSYRGKHYAVSISDSKDFWIIKDIQTTPGAGVSSKKFNISLSLILLVLVSGIGYLYQFGVFGKGNQQSTIANQTVFDAYSKQSQAGAATSKPIDQNPDQKTVTQALKTTAPTGTAVAASSSVPQGTKSLEQEKADLQKQIASLQKENEDLKKQLSQKAISFVIQQGQTAQDIANSAQAAGIVGSSADFYHMIVESKADQALAPGSYLIAPGTSYPDLIEQLTKGAVHITTSK